MANEVTAVGRDLERIPASGRCSRSAGYDGNGAGTSESVLGPWGSGGVCRWILVSALVSCSLSSSSEASAFCGDFANFSGLGGRSLVD